MRLGEFKRYEKYKDSGVEWIGEVPVDWTISKIKYSTYVKGRIGWQGLRADEFIDEGPFLVTGTDFMNGEINWDTCYHVSLERYNEAPAIQLKEGDLLITKDGTIGKVAIVYNKPEKAILNSGIFVTRALGDRYFSKYMYWLLNSCIFNIYIDFTKTGSTIVHLYQETFEDFSFPLPSIKDQKQIIDFLDQKTSEIDSLIADKEKLIELLQEKRQAIISEAVIKGLDQNVKMKDSGIEWIGEVPEGWESSKIKYIADINARTLNEAVDEDYEITYLDISNVNSNGEILNTQIYRFKDAPSRARRIIINGDTIVSTVRTYLQAIAWIPKAEENLICSTGFAVLSPKNKILPEYLAYLLRSTKYIDEIVARSVGVSYPAINASDIGNLECFIPTLEEQSEIISFINEQVIDIVNLVEDLNIQIEKLNEYRQSLISEAVTGKIMV